jgi:competence protein ComEC
MAGGYIFLPFSFASSSLAQLLAKGIESLINLLISCSHLFDKFSFISYRIPTPHLITIIGYFLFLLLLLLPSKIRRQKLALIVLFLVFFTVLISYPFPSLSKNLKLTFIDVGQGESILVEFPGRKKMLIDGGGHPEGTKKMLIDGGGHPEGTFDTGERVVSPFLWEKGIKKIDYLVLTHAHPDHLNGLKAIARNFKIGEYWETFSPLESDPYKEFKRLLSLSVSRKRLFHGHSHQEEKVRIEVLHPEKGEPYVSTISNDQSLVLRFSYIDAEKKISGSSRQIKSQVLKSPHHGSHSSSSEAFLDRVSPEIVVISVGEGNRYGFPNHEILERYKKIGAKVYRTDLHGAVEVSSDGRTIIVRTSQ